jgi:hypothetical protein
MASFTSIPPVPVTGQVSEWQNRTLRPLVQNVELLCGLRGERDNASRAIIRSDLSLNYVADPNITVVTPLPAYSTTYFTADNGSQVLKYDSNSAAIPAVISVAARYQDAVLLLQELENLRLAVANIITVLRK